MVTSAASALYPAISDTTNVANIGHDLREGQGVTAEGKLYTFGGFYGGWKEMTNRGFMYDPLGTGTVTELKSIPTRYAGVSHAGNVFHAPSRNIFILGGFCLRSGNTWPNAESSNEVWRYNLNNEKWSSMPSLPAPRGGSGSAVIDNKIYFFAGAVLSKGHNFADHDDAWVFDLDDEALGWSVIAPTLIARNHVGATAHGGFAYLFGGQYGANEKNGNLDSVERYDPKRNVWEAVAPMPIPLGHIGPSVFPLGDGIVVVAGTTNSDIGTYKNQQHYYNPKTNKWTSHWSTKGFAGATVVAGVIDNHIYGQYHNKIKRTIATITWSDQLPASEPQSSIAAETIVDADADSLIQEIDEGLGLMIAIPEGVSCEFTPGMDFQGDDLPGSGAVTSDAAQCGSMCLTHTQCNYMVFMRGRCYMKATRIALKARQASVSGDCTVKADKSNKLTTSSSSTTTTSSSTPAPTPYDPITAALSVSTTNAVKTASTAIQPSPSSSGQCMGWCHTYNKQKGGAPWDVKCKFKACGGCKQCTVQTKSPTDTPAMTVPSTQPPDAVVDISSDALEAGTAAGLLDEAPLDTEVRTELIMSWELDTAVSVVDESTQAAITAEVTALIAPLKVEHVKISGSHVSAVVLFAGQAPPGHIIGRRNLPSMDRLVQTAKGAYISSPPVESNKKNVSNVSTPVICSIVLAAGVAFLALIFSVKRRNETLKATFSDHATNGVVSIV